MKEASLAMLPLVFSLVPGRSLKGLKEVWREHLGPALLIWPWGDAFLFFGLISQTCIHRWIGRIRVEGVATESSLGLNNTPYQFSKLLFAPGRGTVFPSASFPFPSQLVN